MRENNEYIDFNNIETALNNLPYNNWVTGTAVDFMAYSNLFYEYYIFHDKILQCL